MAKKSEASQTPNTKDEQHLIVTPYTMVITLNEKHQKQVHECLRKSGKVTFSMKEVSVTSLPETLAHTELVIID